MSTTEKIVTQCGNLSVGAVAAAVATDPSGGLMAGAGALAALAGLGAGLRDRHGPQCARVTNRIRKRILADYGQFTEDSAEVVRAGAIIDGELRGCFLNLQALAGAAVSEPGFAVTARDAVLTALAFTEAERRDQALAYRILRDAVDEGIAAGLADPAFMALLQPHVVLEIATATARVEIKIDNIGARLDNIEAQSRDTLEAIALRFGEAAPETLSLPALKAFLIDKSRDLRALQSELEALKGRSTRIDNIRGAAEAALASLNIGEAEALLAEAREIQIEVLREPLEVNAALMQTQARAALLRGDAEAAYTLLSAAADSFAALDPQEPARRRIPGYFLELRNHGLRYGGAGLEWSERLAGDAIDRISPKDQPELWARAMSCRGIAQKNRAARLSGDQGTSLFADSVASYRMALESCPVERYPDQWFRTQNNLGAALQEQGTRTSGQPGADLLAQAVAAYRAALTVRASADHPVDWAMTQNNLGNALKSQGTRTAGPQGADLLAQAVTAYRAALTVHTQGDHAVNWALTQNNLGTALQDQGSRTAAPQGAGLLAQAIAVYSAALTVRTKDDHPVDWAMTQNNLGIALKNQGIHAAGPEGADLLARAVAACRAALTVRTKDDHPVDWAATQHNLGAALQEQGTRTAGPEGAGLLAEAVTAYRAALTVYTQDDHPVQWAMTQENIALAEQARADHSSATDPRPHLRAALTHVQAALRVYDPEHMSYDYDTATELHDRLRARLDGL